MNILITGGSGFLGQILTKTLLAEGFECTNADLRKWEIESPKYKYVFADVRDMEKMDEIFSNDKFDAVFHLAAILSHDRAHKKDLWSTNVDGTSNITSLCEKYDVKKLTFVSTNCLWGKSQDEAVFETTIPQPVEPYGFSKLEAEKHVQKFSRHIIFRCPPIMDEGRVGLLSCLFEFIDADKRIPIVGDGTNRYSFVYAKDVCASCVKAISTDVTGIFNLACKNPKTFNEIYEYVISKSGSKSTLIHISKKLLLPFMQTASFLGISPVGKYQYSMIDGNCVFDISKATEVLGFCPTLSNEEILLKTYLFYKENKAKICCDTSLSPQQGVVNAGVIRLLRRFM